MEVHIRVLAILYEVANILRKKQQFLASLLDMSISMIEDMERNQRDTKYLEEQIGRQTDYINSLNGSISKLLSKPGYQDMLRIDFAGKFGNEIYLTTDALNNFVADWYSGAKLKACKELSDYYKRSNVELSTVTIRKEIGEILP